MKNSIRIHYALLILLIGCTLFASTTEITAQTQTATTSVSADVPKSPFTAPLKWMSSDVLISPVTDETHSIASVKYPTVVRYNGLWHVYATAYSTSARTWNMVYPLIGGLRSNGGGDLLK